MLLQVKYRRFKPIYDGADHHELIIMGIGRRKRRLRIASAATPDTGQYPVSVDGTPSPAPPRSDYLFIPGGSDTPPPAPPRSDYLFIPGGSETGDSPTNEKYCGSLLHFMTGKSTAEPVVSSFVCARCAKLKETVHLPSR